MLHFRRATGGGALIRVVFLAACVSIAIAGTAAAQTTISSINPTGGVANQSINIYGSGFQNFAVIYTNVVSIQSVTIAGVPANSVTVVNDGQIIATVGTPPGSTLPPPGPVTIAWTVTIPGNTPFSGTSSGPNFTYETQMSILAAPSTNFVVGSNYSQTTTVTGGTAPYTFTLSSGALPPGTTLTSSGNTATVSGTITSATSFSYTIQAQDTYGQTVSAPVSGATAPPQISSVTPNQGPQAGGQNVTIMGSYLGGVSSVTVGGKAAVFSLVSGASCGNCALGSEILITTPPGNPGPADIVVTTPVASVTASGAYTYLPAPVITSVSPNVGPVGGGQTITITGSNFGSGAPFVNIGGQSATNIVYNGSNSIQVTTPQASAAEPANVQVLWPATVGVATLVNGYTYQNNPTVSQIAPSAGPLAGGQSVTINGQNFTGATSVTFGGNLATITGVTATTITITTPASTTAGAVNVIVTTPGPLTGTGTYTYTNLPAVTQVAPGSGPLSAGQPVTITGANFVSGSTSITFGSVSATNVVVVNPNQITATAPAGSSGTVQVSATTPSGTGTQTAPYTYTSLPVVSSISPATGPIAGGQSVTISGQNFTGATSVTIGGVTISAGSFTVGAGGTTITTTTPAHAAGQVNVAVTTPLGTGTGVNIYTYVTPLTLASFPATAQQVGKTYSQQNTASGGTPVYTYTLTGGSLPAGTSLSSSTGLVFGTAAASGAYSYTITATDSTVPAQTASVTVSGNIAAITPTVTLTSSVNPSFLGQLTTLTAVVTPGTCTGTISFFNGSTPLCSNVATSNGVAACTVKFTVAGAFPLKATYSGGAQCSANTSPVLTQTVNDQRPQTVSAIGNFLSQRNNQILSEQPDMTRQVDRLVEAGDVMDGKPVNRAPITATSTSFATASGLGSGSGSTGFAGPGGASFGTAPQLGMGLTGLGFTTVPVGTRSPLAAGTSISSLNGMQDADPATGGGSLDAGPLRIAGSGGTGATAFGFSTSLRDLLHYNDSADAAKIAEAGQGFSAGSKYNPGAYYSPFDIWVEGKYSSFRDTNLPNMPGSSASNGLSGEFGLFTVGADYVFNRWLLVGVMSQYDLMSQHTPSSGSTVNASGQGWTVGPYATIRLSENVFWQARGGWGQSSNTVSPYGTYTDSFSSDRWLATSALQGRWASGNWMFRPSATVSYIEDDANSFVDTFGTSIPEVKSQLGQAKVGPEIGYRYQYSPDLLVEPRLSVQAIYNFAGSATSSLGLVPGESAGPEGVRGRVEVGQRAVTSSGIALDLGAGYDGIGAKGYDAYSARAQVHVPLD